MKRATDRLRSLRPLAVVLSVLCSSARAEAIEALPQSPSRADGSVASAQDRTVPTGSKPAIGPPPLDLGDGVIRKAIADSKDPSEGVPVSRGAVFGSGGSKQQGIDRAFREAEIPTCMTMEAYRFDPPRIGPFVLAGPLALPFLVHAIATGQCRH